MISIIAPGSHIHTFRLQLDPNTLIQYGKLVNYSGIKFLSPELNFYPLGILNHKGDTYCVTDLTVKFTVCDKNQSIFITDLICPGDRNLINYIY
jgi:hypothetical protein